MTAFAWNFESEKTVKIGALNIGEIESYDSVCRETHLQVLTAKAQSHSRHRRRPA